jgi:hypothetical protein
MARSQLSVFARYVVPAISALVATLLLVASGSAHHSPTAIFIMDQPVEMEAVLTAVRWVNPHIRLSMEPTDKAKFPESWVFESQPPQWYRRVGVSRKAFEEAIGQTVQVVGRPARNGEPFGFLLRLTFEDGTAYQMVTDRPEYVE